MHAHTQIHIVKFRLTVAETLRGKFAQLMGDSHVGDSQSHMEFDSMFDSCHLVQLNLDIY